MLVFRARRTCSYTSSHYQINPTGLLRCIWNIIKPDSAFSMAVAYGTTCHLVLFTWWSEWRLVNWKYLRALEKCSIPDSQNSVHMQVSALACCLITENLCISHTPSFTGISRLILVYLVIDERPLFRFTTQWSYQENISFCLSSTNPHALV